jgi:hypothetical protein
MHYSPVLATALHPFNAKSERQVTFDTSALKHKLLVQWQVWPSPIGARQNALLEYLKR